MALVPCVAILSPAANAALPEYTLVGSFPLPAGVDSFDVLPDGRMISIDGSGVIRVQDALHAGSFSAAGSVDAAIFTGPFGNFGAGFLRVSPDGSRLAIGDNAAYNRVHVVALSALSTSSASATTAIDCPNFEAAWANGSMLMVTGFGSGSVVSRIDLDSSLVTTVVTGVGGGSGGVTVRAGAVHVGNGFDTSGGGAPTGNVRAFDLAALSGGSPVAFSSGALVADALSGQSLGFDGAGNLLVGGGDFFAGSGDFGYAAVIDGEAVAAALLGGPFAPDSAELRLAPAGPNVPYSILWNSATSEVLVLGGGAAYRYAVPTPGTFISFSLCALVLAGRRRRA